MSTIHLASKAHGQALVLQYTAMGRTAYLLCFPDGRIQVRVSK